MAERRPLARPGDRGGRRGEKKGDGRGGQWVEALGRSRGGFGTERHAALGPLGHPARIEWTGSEAADSPRRPGLIAGLTATAVLADKGCDPDADRAAMVAAGAEPCIPPRESRTAPIAYDRPLDEERNVAERSFARIERHRRVATRYDQKAANYLGVVWAASIAVMLA